MNKMSENHKMNFKRLQTIKDFYNNTNREKEEKLSINEGGNIINITINNIKK